MTFSTGTSPQPSRNQDDPIASQSSASEGFHHSRYQFLRAIGEGGMGVVFYARDRFLQRDLAIKVLASHHADKGDYVDRFIEEAQIAGQLQHPGIVPIHDVGKLECGRPFFAMKLVKGKTLQALLDDRKNLSDQPQRWIDIFGHVCQAVAFAHSKGVIHRDLKPSNVMVGRFDEVQVMDWGLAKINFVQKTSIQSSHTNHVSIDQTPLVVEPPITTGHAEGIEKDTHPNANASDFENTDRSRVSSIGKASVFDRSIIQSIRYSPLDEFNDSMDPGTSELMAPISLTGYGQVIGSIAYMPPEQAKGHAHEIDTRADVFSLGAILAHILTGVPPYVSDSKMDRLLMASEARLEPCWERLATTPFDVELVELCKWCLSADSSERPADASIVADHLTKYRLLIVENLRQAELDRAAVEARLQETVRSNKIDRKRRQWAWVATLAGCALVVSAIASASWISLQQSTVNLAKSNEQNATLERELERVARFDESRMAMQQSLLPIQLSLDQMTSSETVPLISELDRLNVQLKSAYEVFQKAPKEIQPEFNIESLRDMKELQVKWADTCNGPQAELKGTVMKLLGISESSPSHNFHECFDQEIAKLPRWARDRARTELLRSIHLHHTAPHDWNSLFTQSPWENKFWSAVSENDLDEIMLLAGLAEFKSQPLAIQLELAGYLVAHGARSATDQAIEDMNWTLITPTSVKDNRDYSLGVTDAGWIVSKSPASALPLRLEAQIPPKQIVAFRLETYMGIPLSNEAKWLREPTDIQDEKPRKVKPRGMRTAPAIEDRSNSIYLGPGVEGIGAENCNIRDIAIFRESPLGDQVKLKFNRFLTGHTTILGNEADLAIDNDQNSLWALGHRENQPLCSTIFQAEPLSSWQLHEKLICNIEAGNPSLWKNTSLGTFRLYYSTDSIEQVPSPVAVAVKVLEDLNQKHPGNVSILDLLAKANLESGTVAKMNRQASYALASIATVIDPNNSQALRFLADTVLALRPSSADSDYKRLLSQIESFKNESVSREVRARVAKYQLDRGDQMHLLLPEAAFDAYKESQRLDPTNFNRHGRLAYGLWRRGVKTEAEQMAQIGIDTTDTEKAKIDPENLLLYGNIALSAGKSDEAFRVLEPWFQSVPMLCEIDDLQFIRARICFQADQIEQGMSVVKSLEGKLGESPNIWKDAAVSFARCKRKQGITWLLDTLARNDIELVSYADDMVVVRDRKAAWGLAAMAAIELEETIYLEHVLLEKAKQFPEVYNDVVRTADSFLLKRVPPYAPCISQKNVQLLYELLHRIQPDEPRWIIRSAFLDWHTGQSSQAWTKLKSLATDIDGNGDSFLNRSPNRSWKAFARVVAAVMRLTDSNEELNSNQGRTPEFIEAEILAAQKSLGRVPEGDRDLAEWMWWELLNIVR